MCMHIACTPTAAAGVAGVAAVVAVAAVTGAAAAVVANSFEWHYNKLS